MVGGGDGGAGRVAAFRQAARSPNTSPPAGSSEVGHESTMADLLGSRLAQATRGAVTTQSQTGGLPDDLPS